MGKFSKFFTEYCWFDSTLPSVFERYRLWVTWQGIRQHFAKLTYRGSVIHFLMTAYGSFVFKVWFFQPKVVALPFVDFFFQCVYPTEKRHSRTRRWMRFQVVREVTPTQSAWDEACEQFKM